MLSGSLLKPHVTASHDIEDTCKSEKEYLQLQLLIDCDYYYFLLDFLLKDSVHRKAEKIVETFYGKSW